MDYKIAISILSSVLVFVGYAPYIRDIVKHKTHPHVFTWIVWTLATAITSGLQIYGGAGVGVWATISITFVCFSIFILSLFYGTKDITKSDALFLVLALLSLGLWIFAKQPVLSIILIVTTDILGFIPTVRKSWNQPYSETLSTYQITAFRHGLSIFALQQFNILTVLYPIAWVAANAAFSVMLMIRRTVIHIPVRK